MNIELVRVGVVADKEVDAVVVEMLVGAVLVAAAEKEEEAGAGKVDEEKVAGEAEGNTLEEEEVIREKSCYCYCFFSLLFVRDISFKIFVCSF